MSIRMRSPSYPSSPLGQCIDLAEKLFKSERTNPVDREVAAQAMGYSGITGQSAKILSNLIQFGLLEKSGKNEVRVSRRALSILHPDDAEEKRQALRDAIQDPELFQRIREKFPDGLPSESALRSLLLKEGFTDAAIPPAVRSFMDSYEYLQNAGVCDRHGRWLVAGAESQSEQVIEENGVDVHLDAPARAVGAVGAGIAVRQPQSGTADHLPLVGGYASAMIPEQISQREFEDLTDWLDMIRKKASRRVGAGGGET
ncbi:MAG: hypothetical protein ACK4M6_10285 [Hyphomonas sp.]